MKKIELGSNIFIIENFWSADQCDDFIQQTEKMGYEPATVETERGSRLVDFVRNNNRVMYKDVELADQLWLTLKPLAPTHKGNSIAIGLNELFRFYRYEPGQQFRKHRDNSFIRNKDEASYFTFMIYLNDNFIGGQTTFNNLEIKPQQGSVLIFDHYLEHAGSEVIEGTKYVLRTDIMYRLKA
jgi:prolyl 4-hydroxylase